MESISNREARMIALAAQGFGAPKPRKPGAEDLMALVRRLHLIQIDSVNVLVRAHYMPFFSRLGPYPRELVEQLAYKHQLLFEQWAHEACYIPIQDYPLFHHRMQAGHRYGGRAIPRERLNSFASVLEQVRGRGPVQTGEMENAGSKQGWWNWSSAKSALEYHFAFGRLAVKERRNFARVYDLAERVFPPEVLAAPGLEKADAHREMIRNAARALGIATAGDLKDYYRLKVADVTPPLKELMASGELIETQAEGWKACAYRWHEAELPPNLKATALLSPFDNLVWDRARTERLFGFHYRIEIYTPAPLRKYGYYVLPFMLNNEIVARVDLKANRQEKRLEVKAAHLEPGAKGPAAARALAKELASMAKWLNLERVVVEEKGDLAPLLR